MRKILRAISVVAAIVGLTSTAILSFIYLEDIILALKSAKKKYLKDK